MGTGLDLWLPPPSTPATEEFTALRSGGDAPEEELGVKDDGPRSLRWLGGVTTFLDFTKGDIQLFILKQALNTLESNYNFVDRN